MMYCILLCYIQTEPVVSQSSNSHAIYNCNCAYPIENWTLNMFYSCHFCTIPGQFIRHPKNFTKKELCAITWTLYKLRFQKWFVLMSDYQKEWKRLLNLAWSATATAVDALKKMAKKTPTYDDPAILPKFCAICNLMAFFFLLNEYLHVEGNRISKIGI